MKKVMIVADDFGLSEEINRGVEIGVKAGALSFTSLMVDADFAEDAVKIARENPALTVGLHVDASEPLGIDDDVWRGAREESLMGLVSESSAVDAFIGECRRQIGKFFDLGFSPTFINTHFHLHTLPPFFEKFVELSAVNGFKYIRFSGTNPLLSHPDIPIGGDLLEMSGILHERGIAHPDEYIAANFHFFPPELKQEVTEIMVHPEDSPGRGGGRPPSVYYLDLIKLLSWGGYYRHVRYRGRYEELTISGAAG